MEAMAFSFQQAIVRICAVRLKKPSKKKSLVLWRLDPGGRGPWGALPSSPSRSADTLTQLPEGVLVVQVQWYRYARTLLLLRQKYSSIHLSVQHCSFLCTDGIYVLPRHREHSLSFYNPRRNHSTITNIDVV